MREFDPLDEQLEAALEAIRRGRPVEAALADRRPHDAALRPLLETAAAIEQSPRAPLSRRIAHNYAIVQAAVERAQMSTRAEPAPPPVRSPWWQRRLAFASFSLPAGAVALVLTAGAAAAATASVVTTDLGYEVADAVLPHSIVRSVPGVSDNRGPSKTNGPLPGSAPVAPGGGDASDGGPVIATVDGIISDINGATFTLTNADGVWQVQTDAATEIAGDILEGASARVTGAVTAEKNLHASTVAASGGNAVDPSDRTPGSQNTPRPDKTPGPDQTPPPDKTRASNGTPQSDKTPGPGKTPGPRGDPGAEDQGSSGPDAPPGGGAGQENGNGGGNQKP